MSVIKWYRVLYTKSCIFCINFCISCMITSSRCTKTIEPSKYQNTEEIYAVLFGYKKNWHCNCDKFNQKKSCCNKKRCKKQTFDAQASRYHLIKKCCQMYRKWRLRGTEFQNVHFTNKMSTSLIGHGQIWR